MARPFNFAEGEFYHLYNRGTEKRKIFLHAWDYERFISLLYLANSSRPVDVKLQGENLEEILKIDRGEPIVAIGAYCLMPNHFHVLAREISKGGISKFMQKMTTGYTMYFNKINERSGNLFQGRFKAEHASDDRYLKYLFAYIHLNPAKLVNAAWREKGISTKDRMYVATYPHSSYQDYMDSNRTRGVILSKNEFPEYFMDAGSFKNEMDEWLEYANLE
jgi:putative transposase